MALYFMSGTPGSGKSLNVAKKIVTFLLIRKRNVITNMQIDYNYIVSRSFKIKLDVFFTRFINVFLSFISTKKRDFTVKHVFKNFKKESGRCFYFRNKYMQDVNYFYKYAKKFHVKGKEGQTLIVIDEAQMLLSPTVVKLKCQEQREYRVEWLEFLTQHRRLGFDIIMVSQFDRLIDAQVRCLFEYNFVHRKVNNFKIGWVLGLFNISLFISVQYWYCVNKKIAHEYFVYKKKYSRIYDSYEFLQNNIKKT